MENPTAIQGPQTVGGVRAKMFDQTFIGYTLEEIDMRTPPQFKIEQIALCPPDPEKAIELLTALGMTDWVRDIVVAQGQVRREGEDRELRPGEKNQETNVAHLAFNYQAFHGKELEVLHYAAGANWMSAHGPSVSHLGMHCDAADLFTFKEFFKRRGIKIAQEVKTLSHNNPEIAGKRWYQYCIFDTRAILGVDLKFIVRRDQP